MRGRGVVRTLIAALPFVVGTASTAVGAEATPPPPVFSSGVELITIDAVVVDENGGPVRGLTKDDFVVKEDGEPREIMSFEPFVFDAPPAVESRPPAAIASNERPLKDPGRVFGIVIDDAGMAPGEAAQAARTVSSFIETSLRDGDAVLLATTTGDAWWNARLPADRPDLLAVVARLKGQNVTPPLAADYISDYEAFQINQNEGHDNGRITQRVVGRYLAGNICASFDGRPVGDSCQSEVQGRAAAIDANRIRRTRLALDGLTRVSEALAPIRGRKSLLFFSRGFVEDPGTQIRDLVATAREANTAIYFLDVRGLTGQRAGTGGASEIVAAGDGQSQSALVAVGFESGTLDSTGAQGLAEETGGFSVRNTSLDTGVVRVADESRVFYLLGFYPSGSKKAEQWRKLSVEVKQKGLSVRARRGFTLRNAGIHPDKEPARAKKTSPTVVRALDSPRDLVDVPVRAMTYVAEPRPKEMTHVLVAAELDARHLKYERVGDQQVARLEISVIATHRDSPLMLRSDQRVEIRVPALEQAGWRGVSREMDLPVGVSQIRVAVRDVASGAMGSVLQRVVVPPPVGLHISTPIVSDKVDKSGPHPKALLSVHRVFAPQGQVFCQVEVLGAARDGKGAIDVVSAFALMSSDGKPARVVPASTIAADPVTGRLVRLVGLPVADLPDGTYDLVVLVKDQTTGDVVERHEPVTFLRSAS